MPFDQVDVNVHPMKTEVRFKDEWRVYHVLKSGVSHALTEILNTIPNFQRISSVSDSFFQISNRQSTIEFRNNFQGNNIYSSNLEKIDRLKFMPPTLLQLKMKRIILILKNYGKYTKNISFQKLIVVLWLSISTLRMNGTI